jgi:cysteine desulfurase
MTRIYFDNAATTSLEPTVLEAMMPFLTEKFGNPSSIYSYGRETRMAVETARKNVAKILQAHPSEIFFTSGGTESNNTAIHTSVRDLGCTHIITSPIEHHAVTHTVAHLEQEGKITSSYVRILPNGHIDMVHLEELLKEAKGKTLVSLMHANNEIGTMLDIHAVGLLCQKHGAIFHSDTVQTVGHFPFDLKNTHVHFITGAAHKFHGPKGVGLLYINEEISIKPFIFGGGQERNMRAGTENIYGIIGFAKALERATEHYETEHEYIAELKNYMKAKLLEEIPGVSFNGDPDGRSLYTVLSVSFPKNEKTDMLLFNLDIHHICSSGGSACSSGANAGSHVIRALNGDPNRNTIRFSFCKDNSKAEMDIVIAKLKELLA